MIEHKSWHANVSVVVPVHVYSSIFYWIAAYIIAGNTIVTSYCSRSCKSVQRLVKYKLYKFVTYRCRCFRYTKSIAGTSWSRVCISTLTCSTMFIVIISTVVARFTSSHTPTADLGGSILSAISGRAITSGTRQLRTTSCVQCHSTLCSR